LSVFLFCACSDDDTPKADSAVTADKGTGDLKVAPDGKKPQPDGPATPDGPVASLKADTVLKACVIWGSCVPDDGINRCLHNYYGRGKAYGSSSYACLVKTKGCAGIKTCANFWVSMGAPCGPGKKDSSCTDKDTMVQCDDSLAFHANCTKVFGVGCHSGSGQCGTGATCSGNTYTCKGSHRLRCVNGVEVYDEPCALHGLTCNKGLCAGSGAACTSSTCKGDVAQLCVNGFGKTLDCKALGAGFSCKTASWGAGCQQASECDPSTAKKSATCEGDKVVLCHAGKKVKVDCKSLGFSSCSNGLCKP